MMVHRSLRAVLLAAACLLAPQTAVAQSGERFFIAETQTSNPEGDVLDVAAATGQFTRFLAALEAAGYEDTLRGEGPFTVFAPTDEAFRQMDQAEVERLMRPQQRDELLALLAYHVVPDRVTTETVGRRMTRPESANGYRVTVDGRDGQRINDELVVMPDINASNGTLQGINHVLSPPVLVADASANNTGR